jgi:hypothetical protein
MQNVEFSDNYQASVHEQPSEGDWWIIPSLQLLIEQVEFSLTLSDVCDKVPAPEKVADNVAVLTDHTSQSSLRDNALKICNTCLRETLQFLLDVNASTYAHRTDHQEIDCKPTNLPRRA